MDLHERVDSCASPPAMLPLALPEPGRRLRVLALGAHPDDLEIGAGCTLRMLAQEQGAELCWVVASAEGERKVEAATSARAWVGEDAQLELWDFPMSLLPTVLGPLKERFWELAKRFEPDLVLTHALGDRHQDHRVLAELTWQTFRSHTVLEYEIPKYEGDLGAPSLFVPLDAADLDRKCAHLLEHFPSQASRAWFTPETFRSLARIRGVECASPGGYAEAFHARKLTLNLN